MSLNKNFINVTFTQNGVKTKNKINGSLTNDTLCVVSPSTFGKAFVPTHLVNPQRITNTDNPEHNTLLSMRGNLRQNVYGHIYDNLIKHTPNQGYPALENWFEGGGLDAVHTRVLGIGDGIRNEDGSWKNAGFELSEISKIMSFVISQYKDDVNDYFKELLSLNSDENIDDHYFITTQIISDSTETIIIEASQDNNALSGKQISFQDSNNQNVSLNNFVDVRKSNTIDVLNFQDPDRDFYYLINPLTNAVDSEICDVKIKTFENNNEKFNSFRSVYTTAKTPWVTSQPLDRTGLEDNREKIHEKVLNLFRFYSLDDGEIGNRFRIKINPKTLGNKDKKTFSTFDVIIFEYEPRNNTFKKLESFENINLDSNSKDYIGFRIGTKNEYYNIENKKVIVENEAYGNASEFIRVEIDEDIEFKKIKNIEALIPCGFRSYPKLNLDENDFQDLFNPNNGKVVNHLPPKVVIDKNEENFGNVITGVNNSWGIQFYKTKLNNNVEEIAPLVSSKGDIVFQSNSKEFISPHYFHTKYINNIFYDNTKNLSVTEDNYLNSFFHLEKIAFSGNSFKYRPSGRNSSLPVSHEYISISRGGEALSAFNLNGNIKLGFENKLSFDFFTFGGFDGVNIFNFEENMMTDYSLNEEFYAKVLKTNGPIYQAYKTAVDQAMSYENCNGDIIVTPDVSLIELQRYIVDKCEESKRFIHLADASGIYYYFTNNHLLTDNSDIEEEITDSTKNYILNVSDLSTKVGTLYELNHISLKHHSFDSYNLLMKNIISLSMSHNITSRYYFPILAESFKDVDNVSHYRASVSEICRFLAGRYITLPENIDVEDIAYTDCFSESVLGSTSNTSERIELFSKNLKDNLINGITLDTSPLKNPTLTSNLTAFGREYSVFKELELVRRIQLVKKLVMISIFTDESFIAGTVFFSNSSNYNNIYQLLNIQMNILLEDIKNSGLISGYRVNIDPNFMQNKPYEVLENKLSGNIIIQFGSSDIISLSLDNILSELSFLQENTLNESGYNSVEIRSN